MARRRYQEPALAWLTKRERSGTGRLNLGSLGVYSELLAANRGPAMKQPLPHFVRLDDPQVPVSADEVTAAVEAAEGFTKEQLFEMACSGQLDELFPFQLAPEPEDNVQSWDEIIPQDRSEDE